MSDIKYDADLEKEIPDLEVLRLRQEVLQLRNQLEEAQKILEENGLQEVGPRFVEPSEVVCVTQIDLLKQISDKKIPFTNEDIKNLEILVKTLLAIRGKSLVAVDDGKKKKKNESPDIAKLLSIAGAKNFERE